MRPSWIAVLACLLGPAAGHAAPAETAVASGLSALSVAVGCADFVEVSAWGAYRGYRFPPADGDCGGRSGAAAVAIGWTTAAVWANALSERAGLIPAYRDAGGATARDAVTLAAVPVPAPEASGYRLPTLAELGLPRLRARMTRLQEWTGTRVDLGDGRPYYYMCRPGACDFHSPRTSGRGVGFRLVRPTPPSNKPRWDHHASHARQPFATIAASIRRHSRYRPA